MNDLRKVSKRILGFLWIKIMNVLNTVFNSIRDHILFEHVVHKVWFEGQVICDLQENTLQCSVEWEVWEDLLPMQSLYLLDI